MSPQALQSAIKAGWVHAQKHPTAPLWIYNYTPATQYERMWNEVTLQCRGLILDEDHNIVARPFPKFFNLGELENQVIPNEPFEVYEKMDGSLGILYWQGEQPFIATRGSFTSDQAQVANQLLQTKYTRAVAKCEKGKTYLFEIIYPDNRIVVDYGGREELVLLAVIDTATGRDEPLPDIGFPLVKKFDGITDIHTLKALEEDNREGFVIKFEGGLRLKVKFEEYLRLHRIITQVSTVSIWDYLRTGQSFEEIIDQVPDEFYQWVRKTQQQFCESYDKIEAQCKNEFKVLSTRKETALYFQTCEHPAILFAMLDGKPYDQIIWKKLRPAFAKPYSNNSNPAQP